MSKLYLVPNAISENASALPIYPQLKDVHAYFVEEPKSARRLLKQMNVSPHECIFLSLNEHTPSAEIRQYAAMLKKYDCAIISEAGCPCVADPGTELVLWAHQNQVDVAPLAGPSSIIMALMASGLNGQNFAFNGYLPKDKQGRMRKIQRLEGHSQKERQTQIFMEAPYRNESLLADILAACRSQTYLSIASDLTGAGQMAKTMRIKEWKNQSLKLDQKPALFLILAAS